MKAQLAWDDAHHTPHNDAMMGWSPERSISEMDAAGVKTAMLSLASISGNWFAMKPDEASAVAIDSTNQGAAIAKKYPGRFGLLAPLSMLDTDLTLKEITHAFDEAHADGIGLQSSYGNKYAGDKSFEPVWQELNRRKAVVYFHAPFPACCGPFIGNAFASVEEVAYDVTRTVVSLLVTGTLARYRDIRWVISYGGGTIPMLASRIDNFLKQDPHYKDFAPDGAYAEFKRLYYDTVNVVTQPAWGSLRNFIPASQIVYGTDTPYFHQDQADQLDRDGLSPKDLEAIRSGNAKRLWPELTKA
jgi:predicted TIM-barrel fold metal-dependent hydrolase